MLKSFERKGHQHGYCQIQSQITFLANLGYQMGKTSRNKMPIFGTRNYHKHTKTKKGAAKVH